MKFLQPVTINFDVTDALHPVTKQMLDQRLNALDYQGDILGIQTDNTLNPGATPVTNDRYVISNAASIHANFGTIEKLWDGTAAVLGNNDIVQYTGTEFRIAYDVSVQGEGALVWNRSTSSLYKYTGTAWGPLIGVSKYSQLFNNTTDWTGVSAPYTISIAAATHGLGATKNLMVVVYENTGATNQQVLVDVAVTDAGVITISSYTKFTGSVVVM